MNKLKLSALVALSLGVLEPNSASSTPPSAECDKSLASFEEHLNKFKEEILELINANDNDNFSISDGQFKSATRDICGSYDNAISSGKRCILQGEFLHVTREKKDGISYVSIKTESTPEGGYEISSTGNVSIGNEWGVQCDKQYGLTAIGLAEKTYKEIRDAIQLKDDLYFQR